MDSNTHHDFHQQRQNQQPNSGLLRFCSAQSSRLANLTDNGVNKSDSSEGFESERLISRLMNCSGIGNNESASPSFQEFEEKSPVVVAETEAAVNYTSSQHRYAELPPHYPRHSSATSSSPMDGGPYELVGSMAMGHHTQSRTVNSNLIRQSSSPAGLFSHITVQNGYASVKGVGKHSGLNGGNGELSPSTGRLNRQISFLSRLPSSLGMLSQISEIESESIGTSSPDDGKLGNDNGDARFYDSGFPDGPWNNSSQKFSGMKRDRDNDGKLFFESQLGNRIHILSHHLSLPKTSAEMVAMEKFLQFQDSVPCKIRAKRGCATHPRSIAERVRRTRISERMRKLQELVPNMDKQTNTADMLDFAVEYIKDLQKQFKTLSDNQAMCKCLTTHNPVSNQIV